MENAKRTKRVRMIAIALLIAVLCGVVIAIALLLRKDLSNSQPQSEDYELSFTSNGDGTCYISDIKISPQAQEIDLVLPTISPDGDKVTAYDTTALIFQNVPKVISAEDFDAHIQTPLDQAVDDGRMTKFMSDKITEYFFEKKSLENEKTQRGKQLLLANYPLVAVSDIYVCFAWESPGELELLSLYLSQYAGYTVEQHFADATRLIDLAVENGIENHGVSLPNPTGAIVSLRIPKTMTQFCDNAFGGLENLKRVELPEGLTSIGVGAFSNCAKLEEITIPNSVTSIGAGAFLGCTSLKSLVISNGVVTIGERAFSGCTNLKTPVIPDSVTSIGNRSFEGSGVTGVVIPGSVISIGDSAFAACDSLEGVVICEGVKSIGSYAFSECQKLRSALLPKSVVEIQDGAFYNCRNLIGINLPNNLAMLGKNAFWRCEMVLREENGFCFVGDWVVSVIGRSELVFPAGTVGIADNACEGQLSVKSVAFPKGLKHIGASAFMDCSDLTTVTFPHGLQSIGRYAFSNCGLTELDFPSTVKSIGGNAFSRCTDLEHVYLPNSLKSIEGGLFLNCENLTYVGLPDYLETISRSAFEGCSKLQSIDIPQSVTCIDENAFSGCDNLFRIVEGGVSYVDQWAISFDGTVTEVTLRQDTVGIAANAFSSCAITKITFPDELKYIGKNAFCNCGELTSVTLPSNLRSIESWAFYGRTGIQEITLPKGLRSLGDDVFHSRMKAVYYLGTAEDWSKLKNETFGVSSEILYYYSETEPAEKGNYWRYVDGVPKAW